MSSENHQRPISPSSPIELSSGLDNRTEKKTKDSPTVGVGHDHSLGQILVADTGLRHAHRQKPQKSASPPTQQLLQSIGDMTLPLLPDWVGKWVMIMPHNLFHPFILGGRIFVLCPIESIRFTNLPTSL
ncbi:hypothetical protein SLA2020_083310 [Shorea laevis]